MNTIEENDIFLIRCLIRSDKGKYIKGRSYQGEKYLIAKNYISNKFKKGTDHTFHVIKKEVRLWKIFKQTVYQPISHEQVLQIQSKIQSEQAS